MAYPPKAATDAAFKEIKNNPPAILAKTAAKEGAAQANKQRVAIALSKARRAAGGSGATKNGKRFSFREPKAR